MRAIQFKNIRNEKRFCCKCKERIWAQGYHFIMCIERGKYLCGPCKTKTEKESELNE